MGSREEAVYQHQTHDDPELRSALKGLCQIFSSCLGPHGRVKVVQNSVGGPCTMTATSGRLLSSMTITHPCLRLVVSAIQEHLKEYHDGGLTAGSLCLHLIIKGLTVDNVNITNIREVYGVLLNFIDKYLLSDACHICINVDTSDITLMLAYIGGIIGVKYLCDLRSPSLRHVSQVVLRAFLNSVPEVPLTFASDRVFILQFDKADVIDSEVMEGLLLEITEIDSLSADQTIKVISLQEDSSSFIRVAVFNVSMPDGVEERLNIKFEAFKEMMDSTTEYMISKLQSLCDWLLDMNVGLLLCQKVIHPRVKHYLRGKGILFIDRLGLQPMAYILDLSGATPISSVLLIPSEESLGRLSGIQHCIKHGKSFLHLMRANSYINTLILCSLFEEQGAEFRVSVQSAISALYTVIQKPRLLCGRGCWQIHIANYIRLITVEKADEIMAQIPISKSQLFIVAHVFAESLEALARPLIAEVNSGWVDTENGHLWHVEAGSPEDAMEYGTLSCGCGLLKYVDMTWDKMQPLIGRDKYAIMPEIGVRNFKNRPLKLGNVDWSGIVLDNFDCAVSAIRLAVLTACTVLSVSHFISNNH